MLRLLLLLLLCSGNTFAINDTFVNLITEQSCYYSGYNGHLTCTCASNDMNVNLKLRFFPYTSRSNLQKVLIKQCNHVRVSLNFEDVQAGSFPVAFTSIRQVEFMDIQFDPIYRNRQELELDFSNVETFELNDLVVNETLKINATNIKDAHFVKTEFKHIPSHGFVIKNAKDLLVKDSLFHHVDPRSILVEDTKSVLVMGNQMPINALQVVQAVDGSHLMISCNRLHGQPVSPECTKTTMTTTTVSITTTTLTTTTAKAIAPILVPETTSPNGGAIETRSSSGPMTLGKEGITPEIVGGVIAGLLVIILVLIILICLLEGKRRGMSKTGDSALVEDPELEKPLASTFPEKNISSSQNEETTDDTSVLMMANLEEDEEDESKPKFASPIWIDEIQRNKIFNRQKSLLSRDDLKSATGPFIGKPHQNSSTPSKNVDSLSDEEVRENSRTESDDDFGKDEEEPSSTVEADLSYSPLKESSHQDEESSTSPTTVESPNMEKDIDELESLLAKVREQERSLIEGDNKSNNDLLTSFLHTNNN